MTPPLSPADLRAVFGENLRQLSSRYPSVSAVCQALGINRTQFNRYLSGESFPRPDVLDRICRFFDVDARVLLQPLGDIPTATGGLLAHPEIAPFLGAATQVPTSLFPNGIYRFSRRGFLDDTLFLQGLIYVFRRDGFTFLRGYEPREALRQQGQPLTSRNREYRGIVLRQEDGVSILIARRGGKTGSYNFLAPVASYESNFFKGYVTRTVRPQPTGRRVSRMVYEHMGNRWPDIMATARRVGYCTADDLLAHHLRLLAVDQPFF